MSKEAVNARWQTFMADYFETAQGMPDESIVRLEHIFYLE